MSRTTDSLALAADARACGRAHTRRCHQARASGCEGTSWIANPSARTTTTTRRAPAMDVSPRLLRRRASRGARSASTPTGSRSPTAMNGCESTLDAARAQCKAQAGCGGSGNPCTSNAACIECMNAPQLAAFTCRQDTCRDDFRLDPSARAGPQGLQRRLQGLREELPALVTQRRLPGPVSGRSGGRHEDDHLHAADGSAFLSRPGRPRGRYQGRVCRCAVGVQGLQGETARATTRMPAPAARRSRMLRRLHRRAGDLHDERDRRSMPAWRRTTARASSTTGGPPARRRSAVARPGPCGFDPDYVRCLDPYEQLGFTCRDNCRNLWQLNRWPRRGRRLPSQFHDCVKACPMQ